MAVINLCLGTNMACFFYFATDGVCPLVDSREEGMEL